MKKLNVLETFSGIGAQHSALENLKTKGLINYEVIGTSDWDVYAVQAYAAIHYPGFEDKIKDPSDEELENFMHQLNLTGSFSVDGKNPLVVWSRYSKETRIQWYKAYKAAKNIGSVVDSFKRVDSIGQQIDLLTYSFPCQDLSSAGNFHGFNEGIKKHTRSGLLYEIEALIKKLNKVDNKPKFLLLENVVNLVQVQHKVDFDSWLNELEKLGYKTIWGIVNSNDYGLIQARRRVFALSILDEDDKLSWDKKQRNDLNSELSNIYESGEFKPLWAQKIKEVINIDNNKKFINEYKLCQIKDTPSRRMMIDRGVKLESEFKNKISTVTTKQDRWPNVGSVYSGVIREPDKNGVPYTDRRFITPREAYRLMGFNDEQYNNAHKKMNEVCISDVAAREKLYKQAGNSIAVNALEMIFYYMTKLDKEIK